MGIKPFLELLICLSFFLQGCVDDNKQDTAKLLYSADITFGDSINTISIFNPNKTSVSFQLNINDSFPLDPERIKHMIGTLAADQQLPNEVAAWQFVNDKTFSAFPYTPESWQHDLILFLNSIGGGFCDDQASVLAKIWSETGFPSRIIGLGHHIVAEVFSDDKWKMMDTDNGVFYCNENGEIMSVCEIAESTVNPLNTHCKMPSMNPVFTNKNPVSDRFLAYYRSTDNNRDETKWHLNYTPVSPDFVLPPGSTLEITYDLPNSITAIRVRLPRGTSGLLQLPLVPHHAKGGFTYSLNDSTIKVNDGHLFSNSQSASSIVLTDVKQDSEVYYLVNPKFHFLNTDSANKIVVHSSLPVEIKASATSDQTAILFGAAGYFFDCKAKKHTSFISKTAAYNGEKIDISFLRNLYSRFLSEDSDLSDDEIQELQFRFDNDLEYLFSEIKVSEGILQKYYPTSSFYLFLASRYQRMDFLKEIVAEQIRT